MSFTSLIVAVLSIAICEALYNVYTGPSLHKTLFYEEVPVTPRTVPELDPYDHHLAKDFHLEHLSKGPSNSLPPHYDYSYAIEDPHTGDAKTMEESRRGNLVQGRYTVVEPDGSKRIVDYVADPQNGFNAVVRREPPAAPGR